MEQRLLGKDLLVSSIGLGCMGMSHAYGTPSTEKEATELINKAIDLGCTFFDTAEIYGTTDNPHHNEEIVGKALKKYRDYKEQVGLQNYGFLISENRLCVSLSRQKKLLIVVGDRNIFRTGKWDKLAKACVPGMWKLIKLCEREGVIVDDT